MANFKKSNSYILKYDQNGNLYNYVELNNYDKVISYFKIEDRTLIRYDKVSNTKQLIKFVSDVKLKQKFMAGESFISVFSTDKDECVQHNMPEKEREIVLKNNNVSLSDFGKFVVKRWQEINKKPENSENNSIKTTSSKPSFFNLKRILGSSGYSTGSR